MTTSAAAQFFGKAFPAYVAHALDRFSNLHGTLAFSCDGEEKWTVQLGDLEAPVKEGFDRRADCRLFFTEGAFAKFIDGTLTPGPNVKVQGDAKVLERFGKFLGESSSLGFDFSEQT